jgi:hypothetical protein
MDDARRCRAHSSRTGEPCKKAAIIGGVVCPTHGGSVKRVRMSARERIDALVDPSITQLGYIVENGESDAVKLAAIKDVLDRAGYKPGDKVTLGGDGDNPLQILIAQVADRA